ncbi:hypothetical protein LSH36_444g02029 [Paralvinella palmiformis]|uniref:Transcription elongation factor A N-terminal and central domain-containing protein 2 n=1 Tax=Paralvinella palmiformis TaxID=53620 RepID=A0AAD9JAP4_9ANNE|nr:hypothetical protein LSH36_444g02029 [Paralvinella palmiformis]
MDKFIVRSPRNESSVLPITKPRKRLTQSTIESLPGVVVIEDIKRLRNILRAKNQKEEILLQSLKELNRKIPSRSVLKSTKIGHTVNRLTKHSESEVAQKATLLIKKWKNYFQAKLDQPLLEVRSDCKTEELRNTARKHLATALQSSASDTLVKSIEQEAYHQHKRLVGASYRRTVRKIVFALKHQSDVRERIVNRSLDISELITKYMDSRIS